MVTAKGNKKIEFRAKPELEIRIKTAHRILGFDAEAATVRHLVELGLDYINLRKAKIEELQAEARKWGIDSIHGV